MRHVAAELGAGHAAGIAQHPRERGVGVGLDRLAVDGQLQGRLDRFVKSGLAMAPAQTCAAWLLAAQISVEIRGDDGAIEIAETAMLMHLARGIDQPADRRAVERGGEADAAHPGGFQFGD